MKTKKIHCYVQCDPQSMGFTLLELVLIMTLISILTIGFYSNITPPSATSKEALLKVAYDIRFAQDRAMVTGRNHGFRTLSTTQYEIYDTSPGNPTIDPNSQTAMSINLTTNYPNVSFPTNYQIEFDPLGSPVVGGGSTVTLNNGSIIQSFTITNNTGLINLP